MPEAAVAADACSLLRLSDARKLIPAVGPVGGKAGWACNYVSAAQGSAVQLIFASPQTGTLRTPGGPPASAGQLFGQVRAHSAGSLPVPALGSVAIATASTARNTSGAFALVVWVQGDALYTLDVNGYQGSPDGAREAAVTVARSLSGRVH